MSYLYKIISTKLPSCLYKLIPPLKISLRYPGCFQTFHCRTMFFQNSSLLFTTSDWNKLDSDLKNIDSHAMFSKKLLTFLKPLGNDTYGTFDPLGVRLLNILRLGFNHLREHKFKHDFVDTLNSLRSWILETEDTEHYFLRCQNNLLFRTTLMKKLTNINTAKVSLNSNDLLRIILYGD